MPPIPAPLRERFPVRLAVRYLVFLIDEGEGHPLRLLTSDPFNIPARQRIALELGVRVGWSLGARARIEEGLRQGYGVGAEIFEALLEGREADASLDLRQETTVLDVEDSEASAVRFVNQIFREALQARATDIHIEPMEDDLCTRHRIDGVLHEVLVPPKIKVLQDSVISRVKIMAWLDIAERRFPQDGRFNLELKGLLGNESLRACPRGSPLQVWL